MASGSTQNGYPIDPALRQFNVPGTGINLQLIADGNVGAIMVWAAGVFNAKVEGLDGGQCGGYDKRAIGGLGGSTSNHRSGTAMDLNYSNFPQGPDRMSAAQKATCRAIIATAEGTLRWGGDYGGGTQLDQQHFEMNSTDSALVKRIASKVSGSSPSAIVGSTPTSSTANTSAVVKEPLPPIGPAAQHAVIQLTRGDYVDKSNRLAQIRIAGNDMTGDFTNSVQSVTMSYSASQIGQFSMQVVDTPDGAIIGSGILTQGTSIDFNDQHLEVTGVDIRPGAGGPVLTVKAQSRVIGVLRGPEHRGKGSWGEQDVTGWVYDRCREAGAIPVIQGNLGTLTFTRNDTETTLDTMMAAARTVGAWCYEFEQILTFMRPSSLATRQRARWWELDWRSNSNYTNGMVGIPSYSWSAGAAESLSVQLVSGDADLARPGDGVTMTGNLDGGLGEWIVVQVDVPGSITAPVTMTCARVIDPEPQPVTVTT